jgi:dTDP-4-dehydrorhamnose reductase
MTRTLWLRIMLTGKNGQVGWELQRALAPLGDVVALDRTQLNLADPSQIRERVREIKPGLIVNAAAYTAVDRAEAEPAPAMAVNGIAPGILAEEAKRIGAVIVHYSTDYVFDGAKTTPYTEEDAPNPLNVYGRTKLAGEQALQAVGVPHLILRTSWVYGMRGQNFLLTVLKLLESDREELRVVDDQVGAPTWCRMVAEATAQIIAKDGALFREKGGLYHLSAGGQTSWYGFAGEIMRHALHFIPYTTRLRSIPTSEYPTPARRPAYSVLSNDKIKTAFGVALPGWEQGLKSALERDQDE